MADARLQLFFLPIADCRSFAGKDEIDVYLLIISKISLLQISCCTIIRV